MDKIYKAVEANKDQLKNWDQFVNQSINGTIFHLRKFLSYHGDKFKNKEKFLVITDENNVKAQISMAIDRVDGEVLAKSPYGASYGGFVFLKRPSYQEGRAIVKAFIRYLEEQKISRFVITFPISVCSKCSLDTFYFNLLENDFKSINRDVSSVVCFNSQPIEQAVSKRSRNMARKAIANDVRVEKRGDIEDFYQVMATTFQKHQTNPTHTIEEFKKLKQLLPNEVYVTNAYKDDKPIAGIGNFVINNRVNSSFYFCQDPAFRQYQGLSLLVLETLKETQKNGFLYYDFGTSTANMVARENIFLFKESFSEIGYFRETFEWTG